MRNHPLSWTLRASLLLSLTAASLPAITSSDPAPPGSSPPAPAADPTGRAPRPALVTDPDQVFSIPSLPRPGYLVQTQDPVLGSFVMRIANDTGLPTTPVSGTWGRDARHGYSKRQPWNADQSLIAIENRDSGSPSPLFLDGATYLPRFGPPASYPVWDWRWHPAVAHRNEQVNVNKAGTELIWYDVVAGARTRNWTLPFAVEGLGQGEGNTSQDGRFVVLGDQARIFVVDMDPQPPHAPYPHKRIGPAYTFPPCSLVAGDPSDCRISHLSVSPSGRYVEVKYSGPSDTTQDIIRIYEIDPVTLAIRPHRMASSSLRCGSFAARPNGWIYGLKHADMALDPFDGNEDVIIGGRSCPGSSLGRVVKVRLRDGKVTALTDPANEPSVQHVSTRNLGRPGWAYVGYYRSSGRKYSDEIVAVRMDGSQTVERLAHKRSVTSGCYRCESHPVPSPDGRRVIFASNWAQDCGSGCGSNSDIKDYVVWQPGTVGVADPPPGPPPVPGAPGDAPGGEASFALRRAFPNPATGLPTVEFSLADREPARLELIDVAGRVVMERDLGTPGPGSHTVALGPGGGPAPGIYWLRLQQGRRSAATKVVLIHR